MKRFLLALPAAVLLLTGTILPDAYARVLTGGSTGGWEAFALQVFYPDCYGGAWAAAPDPLDFRNVEGIMAHPITRNAPRGTDTLR